MITSVKVDDELWRDAKIYCIQKGITLGDLLESLLKQKLKEEFDKELARNGS
jgi:hypothetical protein